jgi:hypothetical protein
VLALVRALTVRVAALEARFGPRDRADAHLVAAIATAIGSRPFLSRELLAYARTDPALASALEAADIVSAYDLGNLLARLQGQAIDELRVARLDVGRAGTRWQITASGSF